jgi:hypothetical protein
MAAKELLESQKKEWSMLAAGSASLSTVEVKKYEYEGFTLKVQFNPGRIISTSAKVDAKSINERKCFLCPQNLPPEQKGILYKDEYIILCNPFPIFPEHYTIPAVEHTPQLIEGKFATLLEISKDLSSSYTVFYNGPKCGASAPDHFHFQAGDKFFMPIDDDFEYMSGLYGAELFSENDIKITAIDDGLRKMIAFESSDISVLSESLDRFYDTYKNGLPEEPMINILSFYETDNWRVVVFLREKHRPTHYFREGAEQIMLSPASVDLGGVCITPLEKDFRKVDEKILKEIFNEVFLSEEKFAAVNEKMKTVFK